MANDATVHVTGNLVRDPKSSVVNGQVVANFTIAANTTLKKTDGEGYETNYYNVEYWGQPAKWLLEKVQKGTQVEVDGDLVLQKYTNKDGQPGQSLNIKAYKVIPRQRLKDAPVRQPSMDPEVDDSRPF